MELIPQGLAISALGLLTAFLAMSLFIGVIIVLKKLFPAEAKPNAIPFQSEPIASGQAFMEDEAIVAAIAVALARARLRSQASLGAELLSGRNAWWFSNLLASRRK